LRLSTHHRVFFEDRLVAVLGQPPRLGSPHIVEGVVHLGDDVKAVKNVDRMGAAFADDSQIGLPHVRADELDAFRQRFADQSEELLETFDGAILADPQQACKILIDLVDQRQIFVALGVLDLVDADGPDWTEAAMLQPPRDHILHRLTDFVPVGAERHGGFLPGELAGPVRQKHHVGPSQLVLADRPGQLFDPHPAGPAIDPPHVVEQKNREAPDRDEFEAAKVEQIIGRAALMTTRTHGLRAAAGPHVDLDAEAVRTKPSLLVDEARKVLTLIEKADQPHATKPQSERHVGVHLTGSRHVWGCTAGGVLSRSGTVASKLDVRSA